MGAIDKKNSAHIEAEQIKLAAANKELKLDLTQAGLDVTGIFDPSPASDGSNAALSLYRGHLVDAGLSVISMIPWAGDAVAKPFKGTRLASRITKSKKSIEASIAALRKSEAAQLPLRLTRSAEVRAKRVVEQAKKIAAAKICKKCKPPAGNTFGSASPVEGKNGSWKGGEQGNSEWHPDPHTEKGKKVLEATGGKSVEFKNGYPIFTPHAQARVEIDMKGNHGTDMTAARDAMREKLNDPKWPNIRGKNTPKNWTWHHHEDGVTMELVPTELNNEIKHTGGASIVKEIKEDPGY